MRKVNHKKIFIAILLAVCVLALSSLSFAVVSVSGIVNTAKTSGLNDVESMLGLKTDVGPSIDTEAITVPAGQPFLITLSSRIDGTFTTGAVCSGIKNVSYNDATDPTSVNYTFLSTSAGLDQTSRAPNPTTVTLYEEGTCGRNEHCCAKSYSSPATTYINFTYKKIITVPSNQPDGDTSVTIAIDPADKNNITNTTCTIPGATVSADKKTVTIPVKVYTPLRKTFQIKKWK